MTKTRGLAHELGKEARPDSLGDKGLDPKERGQERKGAGLEILWALHHLLRLASFPAGSTDLSSLSLGVSRTTGEQPSIVPARLHAQDGEWGLHWTGLCLGVSLRSASASLTVSPPAG